jgi:nitroreductase
MSDLLDIEKMRYTVRSYSDKELEQEKSDMILEAASIGVGSSWISYFDKEKAKKLLNLSEKFEPMVLLLLGYPTEDSKPNNVLAGKRLPIEKTVFYNMYLEE